ncbi:hypothetical protein [Streptomyces sp. enrichment culture]|uniref:hypothetical protein n=1 Tax=Streptomyces sp. enrichment culture TaxID=1795815 RepID=UPI003F552FB6
MLVFAGSEDPLAAPDASRHWQQWASGPIVRHTVAGDHFFADGAQVPRLVGRACRDLVGAAVPGEGR